MANDELIALLKNLQGSGAGGVLNPGLLAQLPPLIAAAGAAEPKQAAAESRGSVIASAASTVASSALRTVGGGLTLLPVVSSLLKLFGVGQNKEDLPAPERFDLPPPIRAEAGLSQSGETFLIDRGVGDRIRQLPAPSGATSLARSQSGSAQPGTTPFAGSQSGSAQPATIPFAGSQAHSAYIGAGTSITVNVQAMDSQSFMERREDIARAVREAMLQSHSLNDVVSEL